MIVQLHELCAPLSDALFPSAKRGDVKVGACMLPVATS